MKDLELILRLHGCTSIGSRGFGYGPDPQEKRYKNLMIDIEIFSGDSGSRLFALQPECGECFAPCLPVHSGLFNSLDVCYTEATARPGLIWHVNLTKFVGAARDGHALYFPWRKILSE